MRRHPALWFVLLLGAAALLLLAGLGMGSQGFAWPFGTQADELTQQTIVWQLRAPRSVGAFAAGALLGLAGAVAQGLFRNPLADPFLLGSAGGAALAVALTLLVLQGLGLYGLALGGQGLALQLGLSGAAFVGAIAAVVLTLVLARGATHGLQLLLSGVVVGMVMNSALALITLRLPQLLPVMQSFMFGSTTFISWAGCGVMLSVLVLVLVLALACARVLDALTLGEDTARSLGLPVAPLRLLLIAVLALACGTAVAQTGLIAFVGLAAPHMVRTAVRSTHQVLLLLATLMGGVLLLGADVLARGLLAPEELPVGALTGLLGGCYLLWLMRRGKVA